MRHPTRVRARPARDITSAGGGAEAKMLPAPADAKLLGKSTSEKIKASGVSRATWYRRRQCPLFRARMSDACRHALDEHTGPVLQALADSAKVLGKDGHPDRKLFP